MIPIVFLSLGAYVFEDRGYNVINFFFYFTTVTNLSVGLYFLLKKYKPNFNHAVFRGGLIFYSLFTVLGFWVAMGAKIDTSNVFNQIMIILEHSLCLLIIVLDAILFPLKIRLQKRQIGLWILLPILYLLITFIRGAITGWYPYEFLNPNIVNIYVLTLVVTSIALIVCFTIYRIENRIFDAKKRK
jgi:hypothetical protein